MGLTENPQGLLSQPPVQTPQQYTEPSRQTPVIGNTEQRLQKAGITLDLAKKLLRIRRELKESWALQRRVKIRQVTKAIEYGKGNQFIVLDPYTDAYYNPFVSGGMTTSGDPLSSANLANLYQYSHNYIQFLEGVYVSILKASIPRVEWWPDDAESDLDNRAAQTRSRAARKIARDNNESALLEQSLKAFFYAGSYFRHTRYSMDERLGGEHYEDVEDWQDQELQPDRFTCPNCGTDNPVTIPVSQAPVCQNCGASLKSADFYPRQSIKMPVVVGRRKVPQGQVRQSIYHVLHVDVMPMATCDGGSVIINTPILDLEREIFSGTLRGMYPDAWDLAKKGASDSSSPDGETARLNRLRIYSPSIARGVVMPADLPTYHQTWFQPDSYDFLDKREDAKALHEAAPEGLCLATIGDEPLDARKAVMHKEWTWGGTRSDLGAYPPARVQPAMDIQDEINDDENTIREFCDRCANGPILYNEKLVGEQLNGQHMAPGTMKGIVVNQEVGRKLEDVFFQLKMSMDQSVFKHAERLVLTIQLLTRITPQTYGGTQKDIDTAAGQEQALKVAMGVLWGDWDQVRQEFASASNQGVDCFAANAQDDIYNVIQDADSPDFKNEPIRLADLAGNARAYPEADQGYPIGYEQQRQLYRELIGMASGKAPNPLVMEVLDSYENRRLAMRYLGPPDMKLPEDAARYKVLRDLTRLVEEQPIKGLDPVTQQPTMLPSVMPDKDFLQDYWEIAIATAVQYGLKNYQLAEENQPAFENLTLYLQMCRFYQKVGMAQAALPPGGMPPQLTAGDEGGTPGKVAPTPAPPSPVGAQAMPVQ